MLILLDWASLSAKARPILLVPCLVLQLQFYEPAVALLQVHELDVRPTRRLVFDLARLARLGCPLARILARHVDKSTFVAKRDRVVPHALFDKCGLPGLDDKRFQLAVIDFVILLPGFAIARRRRDDQRERPFQRNERLIVGKMNRELFETPRVGRTLRLQQLHRDAALSRLDLGKDRLLAFQHLPIRCEGLVTERLEFNPYWFFHLLVL